MNRQLYIFRATIAVLFATGIMIGQALAKPPTNSDPNEKVPQQLRNNMPPNLRQTPTTQSGGKAGPPVPAHIAPQPAGQAAPQPTVQLKPGEVPKIEFDTPTYDFGRIKTGKDIEHDFWFHNTGNGPLEILQVKPS